MDVDAIVRARRREQALEALELERSREAALLDELADILVELEGTRIDAIAFGRMGPEDAARVRRALDPGRDDTADEERRSASALEARLRTEREAERVRLEEVIAVTRRLQHALGLYLDALDAADAEAAAG